MLYQLYKHQFKKLREGFVIINGTYDKYGKILKERDGLFLIRGLGMKNPAI